MQTLTQIEMPEFFSDKVRRMEIGQSVEIDETKRQSIYNQARVAFPMATFITRKIEGKVYLKRTA